MTASSGVPAETPQDRSRARASRAAERAIGLSARLISWSKSGYRRRRPHHLVIFNAELWLLRDRLPFWRGDLDLTLDEPQLRLIAARIRRPFRVTPEGARQSDWVAVLRPDGRLDLNPAWGDRARAGFIVNSGGRGPRWAR